MATTKKYDLAVKTGVWTDKTGKERATWKNVGRVLQLEDGGEMYLLDKTFNPAGVDSEGKDSIVIYRFEPKENAASNQPETHKGFNKDGDVAKATMNDEIPF
jgi:hypothetical protein